MINKIVFLLLLVCCSTFLACSSKQLLVQNDRNVEMPAPKKQSFIETAADQVLDYYSRKQRGEIGRHPTENVKFPIKK